MKKIALIFFGLFLFSFLCSSIQAKTKYCNPVAPEPGCAPPPTETTNETNKDQPAPKPTLEQLQKIEKQASETYQQAQAKEEAARQIYEELQTVDALSKTVESLRDQYNSVSNPQEGFQPVDISKEEIFTVLQNKQEKLTEAQDKLGDINMTLQEAEKNVKDKKDALNKAKIQEDEVLKAINTENNKKYYLDKQIFLNQLEKQQKQIAAKPFNLHSMGITLGSEITTVDYLFANLIKFLSRLIGILAVLSIMVGGVMLTTSAASEDQQQKAKDIILYSILAVVFVLSAYAIVTGIQQIIYSLGK